MTTKLRKQRVSRTPGKIAGVRVRRLVGPSERIFGRELQRLRTQIDNSKDQIVTEISYAIESAIRWARENTVDWPLPAALARELADLLRKEWPNEKLRCGTGDAAPKYD